MRLIKILLCLAFYPSWSSTITAEENAKLVDELEKARKEASEVHVLDLYKSEAEKQKDLKEYDAKLANVMKATNAFQKAIMDDIKREEEIDENEIEENGTSSFTPGMVDEVLKALKTAGASSDDFLKDLNELGPKLASLIKAAVPIGGLVSKKLRRKPESDEYKALEDFKNRSKMIWNDIRTQKPSEDYDEEMHSWIFAIRLSTDYYLRGSTGKRSFGESCKRSKPTPESIMKYLKSHLITECGSPITTKEIENRAKLSTTTSIQHFKDECFLRVPIIENTFNYTRIGWLARKLHIQLIEIAFSSAICSNAMYSERSSMEVYAEEIAALATNITTSTSKWLKESFTAAWPSIHNQILQNQIESIVKQPGHFDRKMLIKAAEITNSILNKTGIPGYTYDMLIVKAPEKNFQFHFESLSNDYYFDKEGFGFNTVLVRRRSNYSNSVNIQDKMRRLKLQIESEMENLYDVKNITEVAEGLKNKLGDFVNENGFRGFAIARKWEKNIFKSCSAIDDVQYSKDSFSSIYNFTYQNSGNMFQHCETFNFYFFLSTEDKNDSSADIMKMKSAILNGVMAVKDENPKVRKQPKTDENKTIFISNVTSPIVDEAVKALKAASESSGDPILDLNELGPKFANLMKAAFNISALIVKKLNPEPESEEYKMLMDFKTQSAGIWNNISAITSQPIRSIGGQKLSKEYEKKWSLLINEMKYHSDIILNPEIKKREDFVAQYRYHWDLKFTPPEDMLRYFLERHMVGYCGASLTTKDVEKIAKDRAILIRFIRRLQVEDDDKIPDPSIYLSKFMNIYRRWNKLFKIEWLDYFFEKHFSNYESAIDAFLGKLSNFAKDLYPWNIEDECLLRALTIEKTFDYNRIGVFVKKLQNELIDFAFSTATRVNALHRDRAYTDWKTGEIAEMVTNITTFSSKWLNESLTSAWPLIHNQVFQDQIRSVTKEPGYFDREVLKKTAELTNSILKKTGIPGYTYEMLIVKAPEKNFQFHIEYLSNDSYFNKIDFGFNTVLIRRPFNYSNHMDLLNLQDKMGRFRIQIESEMEHLHNDKNVTEVAEGLKIKLGDFISENGFRGFSIARKWEKNIFKSCTAIDDVQYSKDSFSSIYNFTYQNSGNMLQHCETFNFYFFL